MSAVRDHQAGVAAPAPARPNPITATLRSEFTKVVSTRLWWILALIMFGYVALSAGGAALLFGGLSDSLGGQPGASGTAAPATAALPPLVYSFGTSIGYVFPVLLGALAATSEFRHQTLTPTLLATPQRGKVLLAKTSVLVGFGAVFGIISMLAAVGAGAAVLAVVGIDPLLGQPDTWALIGRAILAMALWSLIGVGLGVLVPSQVAAIVIVLAFTQFVEPILRFGSSFLEWTAAVGKYLPGAASDALVGSSFYSLMGTSAAPLEWWQGGLVLLAIGLIICVLGGLTTWKRDVT